MKLNSCNACKFAKSVCQIHNYAVYQCGGIQIPYTNSYKQTILYKYTNMCAYTYTHTFRHHVPYTSTYKLIPLRLIKSMDPCASVPITHRHKGRPKRIGNASPHSTKQKFQILHILPLLPLHTLSTHSLFPTPTTFYSHSSSHPHLWSADITATTCRGRGTAANSRAWSVDATLLFVNTETAHTKRKAHP